MILTSTKEKKETVQVEGWTKVQWLTLLLALIGIMISRVRIWESFYTLGVCYIGALYFDKRIRRWGISGGLIGLILSGFWDTMVLKYLLVLAVIGILRIYMEWTKKVFDLKSQIFITSLAFLIINMSYLLTTQWNRVILFSSVLEVVVSCGIVAIFGYSTEIIYKGKGNSLNSKALCSMAFLLAIFTGGMIDFYIRVPIFKSIYFRDTVVFLILIMVTYLGGSNIGVSLSLLMSTVLVVMGYMPTQFVAVYGVAVLIGSIFKVLEKLGVIFAMGVGLLVGFVLFNERVVDMPILGAYTLAAVISLFLPSSYFGLAGWFGEGDEGEENRHLERVQKVITEKLSHFAEAFYKLSHTFEKISDTKVHLNDKDIQYIIEDTGESMCKGCSMREFCWKDYLERTYKCAFQMLERIEEKGQLVAADIPEPFRKGCVSPESFACTLGFKLDLFKQNRMWKNRMVESRKLMGEQFHAIAESISGLSKEITRNVYFNKEDEILLKESLRSSGIRTKDIMVVENKNRKENIHIYTPYYRQAGNLEDSIKNVIFESLNLSVELEKREVNEEEDYCYFKLKPTKVYHVLAGAAFQAKGEISGDVYSFMEVEGGRYLLALADGMGSGKLAMEESTATIELLESFMESGFRNELTMRIINSVLVLKSEVENFSTMDMTLIDEYTGVAEFLKMGGATTFILRDGQITTVQANTLPIGMLKDVDIQISKKQLKDGDVIIMVTDGLLQGDDDLLGKEETFKHFILEVGTGNPSYIAEHLMQKSSDLLGNAHKDDMTIIVARIWK
ncbi:stage II sporulation protein E [Sporanaerobium hydrogeniformans]|uniref:Stage II sporulation protein E n=1 Tax=Sporanaerobium hydrogeniformans TaxID=3072179 RepID=A0AC61DEI9_9FIRM|nr:stage II sporulation protein E [Sporanaerobium hydrogeniformans]PHV71218.1 stage II sporulation protein E [Sporanaerobium hydrogeniformans]